MTLLRSSNESLSSMSLAVVLIAAFVIYVLSEAIHRLFFSQYAKFPGPKLAGLTYGYMFYYDAIAGNGQYYKKIEQLHAQYGTYCSWTSYYDFLSFL